MQIDANDLVIHEGHDLTVEDAAEAHRAALVALKAYRLELDDPEPEGLA